MYWPVLDGKIMNPSILESSLPVKDRSRQPGMLQNSITTLVATELASGRVFKLSSNHIVKSFNLLTVQVYE